MLRRSPESWKFNFKFANRFYLNNLKPYTLLSGITKKRLQPIDGKKLLGKSDNLHISASFTRLLRFAYSRVIKFGYFALASDIL